MNRFLLLNSPIYWDSTAENEQYLSPLGLGYIATYLEKSGIEVELLDCVKARASVPDILRRIAMSGADYVGINIFTQNYDIVRYIMENNETECTCFIGGSAAKFLYPEILQWSMKNKLYIILGDGELIIPQIVLGKCSQPPEREQDTKQVYRVDATSPYFPHDISSLYLNRKFLGNEIVTNHYGEEEIAIVTSRGCIYNCAFCGGAKSLNQEIPTRIRSEESVVKELNEIVSTYPNVQSVRILDDLFLRGQQSIFAANRIFSRYSNLSWRGMAHILPLFRAFDHIKDLRIGHCRELFVGIESGSDRVRKKINKLGSPENVLLVAREILSCGIDLKGYFIYGFPGETEDDFRKTYDLAVSIKEISLHTTGNFRTSVFQFRPYHGTQLYQEILQSTGILHGCKHTDGLDADGMSQFNFDFGNYSVEPDELLHEFIQKTRDLGEGAQ